MIGMQQVHIRNALESVNLPGQTLAFLRGDPFRPRCETSVPAKIYPSLDDQSYSYCKYARNGRYINDLVRYQPSLALTNINEPQQYLPDRPVY